MLSVVDENHYTVSSTPEVLLILHRHDPHGPNKDVCPTSVREEETDGSVIHW